eukprot:366337-Chlamydomonas_euryale.AAC.2
MVLVGLGFWAGNRGYDPPSSVWQRVPTSVLPGSRLPYLVSSAVHAVWPVSAAPGTHHPFPPPPQPVWPASPALPAGR